MSDTHSSRLLRARVDIAVLSLTLVAVLVAFYWISKVGPVVDESYHQYQIRRFMRGDLSIYVAPGEDYPHPAMIPGYHFAMSGLSLVFKTTGLNEMRLLNLILSAALLGVAIGIARLSTPDVAILRAVQLYCFPLLFPFHFIVFTDMFALLLVLAALLAEFRRKRTAAALLCLACLLVKQSSIVYVICLIGYGYWRDHGLRLSRQNLVACAKSAWAFLLPIAFFVVFFIHNGMRVALNHPMLQPRGFSLGNILLSLFLCFWLFLPMHVQNSAEVRRYVRAHSQVALGIWIALAVCVVQYVPTHFNNVVFGQELLRNILLHALVDTWAGRAVLFVVVTATVLSLCVTRLRDGGAYLLYPVWLLSFLPVVLVEPRYYLPVFAMLVLFRPAQHIIVECATWAFYLAGGLWLHYVHAGHAHFL